MIYLYLTIPLFVIILQVLIILISGYYYKLLSYNLKSKYDEKISDICRLFMFVL